MTTSIDRAAKAMGKFKPANPLLPELGYPWDTWARAALASIREPTPEMVEAGAKKVRGGSSRDCAAAVWRAMVDQMMTEGLEPIDLDHQYFPEDR